MITLALSLALAAVVFAVFRVTALSVALARDRAIFWTARAGEFEEGGAA